MRNDPTDPSQSDASSERDADLTDQFWGASPDWTGEQRRVARDPLTGGRGRPTVSNTGIVSAIRDGMSVFKPQLRDASGPIERTRTHGIVRPDAPRPDDGYDDTAPMQRPRRVPIASRETSIAELAAGETAPDFEPHPWERATAGRQPKRSEFPPPVVLDQTGPIEFFDQEVDEIADPNSDGFAAYADMEFEPTVTQSWWDRLGVAGPSRGVAAGLLIVTVLALPFLLSRGGDADNADKLGDKVALATTESSVATVPTTLAPGAAVDPTQPTPAPSGATPSSTNPNASTGASSPLAEVADAATTVATTQPPAAAPTPDTAAPATASPATAAPATPAPTAATTAAPKTTAAPTTAATTAAPTTTQPTCALHYTAGPGDSWYRIADAAGVSPKALLAANNATVNTVILPGDDICLPAGAKKPSPPTTAAPTTAAPTTAAPKATTAPTTAPATTTAPTTAAPTTTTAPSSPGRNASAEEVKQIIRDVFPDDIEEKALDIAYKESRYRPTAYNGWCCYGVFQIYYSVHSKWLTQFGVTKAEDLYDPVVNAKVALAIYQRAGNSFSPWTTA